MSEEKEKSKFKISKNLIIIIGGGFLLLGSVFFIVFILFFTDKDIDKTKKAPKPDENQALFVSGPEDFYPGLLKFGEIIVKLKPEFEEELAKNLRITIYAEVIEKSDKLLLIENKNLIEKYLALYFSGKKPSDLDEITEKLFIKQNLFKKINEISGKNIMRNLYFTEFLILDW
ncbi:MAG: flagellar basal body-associated FliL family protein [Desulforegulaceae bacterium]|nr:flagellar basal body-associated FliL family protein [Desulforegulaceae bacterium]